MAYRLHTLTINLTPLIADKGYTAEGKGGGYLQGGGGVGVPSLALGSCPGAQEGQAYLATVVQVGVKPD